MRAGRFRADAARPSPSELPEPPEFDAGWPLGPPDLVLTLAKPLRLPVEGEEIFRSFYAALGLDPGNTTARDALEALG